MNKLLLSVIFFLTGIAIAYTQPQANFTMDKAGGCSPLTVQLTSTSTGTSANTTYQWNLGNGNSASKQNPGATYYDEKTYTVTLTIKEGANTSTKSQQITVYKKPSVGFSVSPAKGCVPLVAKFASSATSGDGTIAQYYWDFGDGETHRGTDASVMHTYTFPIKPPTSLTVTNSHGCYATSSKNGLVEAVKGVTASFEASTKYLCKAGGSVQFSGNGTGSGTLTYAWDFGDGEKSTEKSPNHAFKTKGAFSVNMTVFSSDGCMVSAEPMVINVDNFTVGFTVPALICEYNSTTFSSTSTSYYTKLQWYIDGDAPYYATGPELSFSTAAGEHEIKLEATYGTCQLSTTKKVTVMPKPQPKGFVVDLQGACGAPLTINFKDTTKTAVKWQWFLGYYDEQQFATTQNASYNFTDGSGKRVTLRVTNKEGCTAATNKDIYYGKPDVRIVTDINGGHAPNCTSKPIRFFASLSETIDSYSWDFGDGTKSTEKTPTHTYDKEGNYTVILNYITKAGCKGTADDPDIYIVKKPKFDFAVKDSTTTICGNTPTTLVATPSVLDWEYYWYLNGELSYSYLDDFYFYRNNTRTLQFLHDTTYTVKLMVANGNCRDTITKEKYLTVLPPFPKMGSIINSCEGTRGVVKFAEASLKAKSWSWDFGDGSKESYTSFKDTVAHNYAKTGAYKVVLSATNGACTVKDSSITYVYLKQNPMLSSTKTSVCGSDVLDFKLSGYEANASYSLNYIYWDNDLYSFEYENGVPLDNFYSNVIITNPESYSRFYFQKQIAGTIQNLKTNQFKIRAITKAAGAIECNDTSNYISVRIHGPSAALKIQPHSGCFKTPVFVKDLSTIYNNVKIVEWQINWGDGSAQQTYKSNSANFSHTYATPGGYYITLTVVDADGCTSTTGQYDNIIEVSGPKADFYASTYTSGLDTDVYFYNQAYGNYYSFISEWTLPDGSKSADFNSQYRFTKEGKYDVRLVTNNATTNCRDTVLKTITIKKVNSAYSYTLSYVNGNACPPVMATFISKSNNYARLAWDFGDGGVGGDQQVVSHTYNDAGVYKIMHYSYDVYGNVDSVEDVIEIKGPYALITADTTFGCGTLAVKLSAEVKHAKDYTWDFGDGTLIAGTSTAATHTYLSPGIYRPALILKDEGGCTSTSILPKKIIVDSLAVTFSTEPKFICDAGIVSFIADTYSISHLDLQAPLIYRWTLHENSLADTIHEQTATHNYNSLGKHAAELLVQSKYGCSQLVKNSLEVIQGVKADIASKTETCQYTAIAFAGLATPATGTLQWSWNFDNGQTSNLQNPDKQRFDAAGQKIVSLVVNNGNCADTANFSLVVHPAPKPVISISKNLLCLGDSIKLSARGGDTYQWSPADSISNTSGSTTLVWPRQTRFYTVTAGYNTGCATADSIEIKVVAPFNIEAISPVFVCQGYTAQLNASGADKYVWNNDPTLSNTQIANPTAKSTISTSYTVVGYHNENCFTDTAIVQLNIGELPTVSAGKDQAIIYGAIATLQSMASSNVVRWKWLPNKYLECDTCPVAEAKPKVSTLYELTVYTAEGCFVKDTVRVEVLCKNELIYIPTGFTPNGDNLNDRFAIHGSGIKAIRHLNIYDRWGKPVFERKGVDINDSNSSWDGKMNGTLMPAGAYVYFIEVECSGGDVFTFKGTVTLLR